jgi:glycerate kinase
MHSVLASDGGDGFLDAVANYVTTEKIVVDTVDPLERPLKTTYLINRVTKEAYIELAAASGLVLLENTEKNPMNTSTFGTGIQIRHAIKEGAKTIYVGLGGSATNDGGIGIANALGYTFSDASGKVLKPIGSNLSKIDSIESPKTTEMLKNIIIYAVNDVNNPLFGENGAAHIYAIEKGAGVKEIAMLDDGLRQLDKSVQKQMGIKYADIPGAGAAGGTAYGLKTFANAQFVSGIDYILKLAKIHELLKRQPVDYLITGEGKIDSQTLNGKLIKGILDLGRQYNIPVIAVCGSLDVNEENLKEEGLHEVLEISDRSKPLAYNMRNASELIERAIYTFFKENA